MQTVGSFIVDGMNTLGANKGLLSKAKSEIIKCQITQETLEAQRLAAERDMGKARRRSGSKRWMRRNRWSLKPFLIHPLTPPHLPGLLVPRTTTSRRVSSSLCARCPRCSSSCPATRHRMHATLCRHCSTGWEETARTCRQVGVLLLWMCSAMWCSAVLNVLHTTF